MTHWTTDQILALAPDSSAAAAGRGLAAASRWEAPGCSDAAVWGLCRGSGSSPYQVRIDLSGPAYRCSCPSRRFPCKHAIGLFLLWAEHPHLFSSAAPPVWVTEWLEKRAASALPFELTPPPPKAAARSASAAEKRAANRESRVAAGIEEIDLWLRDLVRAGLASAQTQKYAFWEDAARRMVDVQAQGIARRIREMASIPNSGEGWPDRLLEAIGRLRLLIDGFRRIQQLPLPLQQTIQMHVGWTVKQESLAAEPGERNSWLVAGVRVTTEGHIQARRTWLLGNQGQAMLLHFAGPGQSFEPGHAVGKRIDAELVYYPGALRQRAMVREVYGVSGFSTTVPAYDDFRAMLTGYAQALAADPWLVSFCAPVAAVMPVPSNGGWNLVDRSGNALPLPPASGHLWPLYAISGGRPVIVTCEWDGHELVPLSCLAENRFSEFGGSDGRAA